MSFEVLLSAMHLRDESYIDTLGIHTDCVVVNQCDRQSRKKAVHDTPKGSVNVSYIETVERGLSKSRNMAIAAATADVCILCDNDVEYVDDYDEIISGAFEKYDADVIVFFIKRPERQKPVFDRVKKMGYLSVLKIFSPEVAFRRSSIEGISFNELFGAGARFFLGEENLFLYECLKRGKKVLYVPEMIAQVRDEESTWFKGYDRDFFISRGANYAAMTRAFSSVLILQFALRKRHLYLQTLSMKDAIAAMYEGRRQYMACREKP